MIPDLPDESPFDPVTMTFRTMKILPECIQLPGFEGLGRYLADDTKGMRLFQISQKISDLFDQYLVFRPDMIFRWEGRPLAGESMAKAFIRKEKNASGLAAKSPF